MSEFVSAKRERFRELLRQKAGNQTRTASPAPPERIGQSASDPFDEMEALDRQEQFCQTLGIENPYFRPNETITADTAVIDGRELISFSSYNYLGFAGDPRVIAAAQQAIARYGTSVSASRIVTGEKPLHGELENELARLLNAEDAVAFVSGHATNVSVIGHLFGSRDLILYDSLAHNSIYQGCCLSGARHLPFAHNDAGSLERLLQQHRHRHERVLIAVEGVYSMDGDIVDLPAIIDLKKRFQTMLLVDEAHSLGVVGATGRGIHEHFDVNPRDVDLWMGTLSKSLASCGGYIAGESRIITYLRYTTPGMLYSVGMTPANAAAALAACQLLRQETERVQRLRKNSELFLKLAQEHNLNTGLSRGSAVIPIIVGGSSRCLQLAHALFRQGINVHPLFYPAVPENAARLRFFVTSEHSDSQLRQTVQTVAATMANLPVASQDIEIPAAVLRH